MPENVRSEEKSIILVVLDLQTVAVDTCNNDPAIIGQCGVITVGKMVILRGTVRKNRIKPSTKSAFDAEKQDIGLVTAINRGLHHWDRPHLVIVRKIGVIDVVKKDIGPETVICRIKAAEAMISAIAVEKKDIGPGIAINRGMMDMDRSIEVEPGEERERGWLTAHTGNRNLRS